MGQIIDLHLQCTVHTAKYSPLPPAPTLQWYVKQNTAIAQVANSCHHNNATRLFSQNESIGISSRKTNWQINSNRKLSSSKDNRSK